MQISLKAIPTPDDLRIGEVMPYFMSTMESGNAFQITNETPMILGQVIDPDLFRQATPPDLDANLNRLVIVADPKFVPQIFTALDRVGPRDLESNPDIKERHGNPKRVKPSPKQRLRTVYQKMDDQNMTVFSITLADEGSPHGFFCFIRTRFTILEFFKEMGGELALK